MPADTWDSYKETLQIILENLSPKKVLEWGPGHSTDIMATFRSVEQIVSIEHDRDFFEKMRTRNYPELELILEENLDLYPDYPVTNFMGKFDLIFVDGRCRPACLLNIREKGLLNPGGVVIVHDADRSEYHDQINKYPYKIFTDKGNTAAMAIDLDGAEKILTKELSKITVGG